MKDGRCKYQTNNNNKNILTQCPISPGPSYFGGGYTISKLDLFDLIFFVIKFIMNFCVYINSDVNPSVPSNILVN